MKAHVRWAVLLVFLLSFYPGLIVRAASPTPAAPQEEPAGLESAGESDRLAIPSLSPNPTQLEYGISVYYYNCMPCHGDRGQGLTDEFRQLWVEDHQNCWGRGCHAGRTGDEGYPLPRFIPAVKGPGVLAAAASPEDLFAYLKRTHPPQRPGKLSDGEYWAVSAYLLDQNGRLTSGEVLGETRPEPAESAVSLGLLLAACSLLGLALVYQARQPGFQRNPLPSRLDQTH